MGVCIANALLFTKGLNEEVGHKNLENGSKAVNLLHLYNVYIFYIMIIILVCKLPHIHIHLVRVKIS